MLLRNGRDLSPPLIPRFPVEILLLIVELGSFETRAKLVRCNKWLYKLCTPLLYQEICLHTPAQLLKLYRNRNSMRNVKKTETMFIDQAICYSGGWEGIRGRRLRPSAYLIRVLQAAVSLRRLQLIQNEQLGSLNRESSIQVESALHYGGYISYPLFLPNLEVLVDTPMCADFTQLCYDRAVVYNTTLDGHCLEVNTFPALNSSAFHQTNLTSLARSRIACSPYRDLSASDVGRFIRETIDPSLRPKITFLKLNMRSADAILQNKTSPIHDLLDWVRTMLSTAECFSLGALIVEFEPKPHYQPASVQYSAIKKLQEILPKFHKGVISYPDLLWARHRYPTRDEVPRPPHLADVDWTPDPGLNFSEALTWWLETLGLHVSRTHGHEELKRTAAQLRDGMRAWWSERSIPSENELYAMLLARTQ